VTEHSHPLKAVDGFLQDQISLIHPKKGAPQIKHDHSQEVENMAAWQPPFVSQTKLPNHSWHASEPMNEFIAPRYSVFFLQM